MIRKSGKGAAFTLIELLVVIGILGVLLGLLIPAVMKVRESSSRLVCSNNLKQIGLAVHTFEGTHSRFPRAGEHFVTLNGTPFKTQCYQSCFTLILPYVEQDNVFRKLNLRLRYNEQPNLSLVAQGDGAGSVIKTYLCPTNPIRPDNRDSQGFACADYAPLPYVEVSSLVSQEINFPAGRFASALTAAPYPANFYQMYAAAVPEVSQAKSVQLKPSSVIGSLINVFAGGSRYTDILDGASNSIAIYEDVGRNESMTGAGGSPNSYLDPVDNRGRRHWRWAEPDSASGCSKVINNKDLPATANDNANNNEWYSFHPGGANACMADGSVRFFAETISLKTVYSLGTRSGGETIGDD